jgi:tetratricopeptide (TPR) repeat protein
MDELPKELTEAVKKNNLVIFAGAGLSFNLRNRREKKLGGWSDLIKHTIVHFAKKEYRFRSVTRYMLKKQGYNSEHRVNFLTGKKYPFRNAIQHVFRKKHNPISILSIIEDYDVFPKNEILKFIASYYSLSQKNSYDLHKKLCLLSKIIITTNYDNAFEIAQLDIKAVVIGKNNKWLALDNPDDAILFKLHGCITDSNTMVVFPSEYDRLYYMHSIEEERILLLLQKIIAGKRLLLIGCGMGDWQIKSIFMNIRRLLKDDYKKHFIITKKNEFRDELKDFLTPVVINDYDEIDEIIDCLLMEKSLENTSDPLREMVEKKLKNEREPAKKQSLMLTVEGMNLQLNNEFEIAVEKYREAIRLNGENDFAFTSLGIALKDMAKVQDKDIVRFRYLLEESIIQFCSAAQINPDDGLIFAHWGEALYMLSKFGNTVEILEKSSEKYQRAVELNSPTLDVVFNNWGNTLHTLAVSQNNNEMLEKCLGKYQKAIALNPNNELAYDNWGVALLRIAIIKKDITCLKECLEKHRKASEINPNRDMTFYNWGNALHRLYSWKKDKNILKKSMEKYKKALSLNPNNKKAAMALKLLS